MFADANPPSTLHWIYDFFEKKLPVNAQIIKYKPALKVLDNPPEDGIKYARSLNGTIYITNPDADYIHIQGNPNYWLNQVPAATDDQINVNCQGEFGFIVKGRPVHPEYREHLHYSPVVLTPQRNVEVGIGFDFGLTPACVIVQLLPNGQLVVLDNLYCEGSSLEPFVENVVVPHLDRVYSWWRTNHLAKHDRRVMLVLKPMERVVKESCVKMVLTRKLLLLAMRHSAS